VPRERVEHQGTLADATSPAIPVNDGGATGFRR